MVDHIKNGPCEVSTPELKESLKELDPLSPFYRRSEEVLGHRERTGECGPFDGCEMPDAFYESIQQWCDSSVKIPLASVGLEDIELPWTGRAVSMRGNGTSCEDADEVLEARQAGHCIPPKKDFSPTR